MSQAREAGHVRTLVYWSAWVGTALLLAALAAGKGPGPLVGGAALGIAGSFAILWLRTRSVSKVLGASTKGEAARGAFLCSLGKLAVAFVVMSLGALMGKPGAVGALLGLLVTAAATVCEGTYASRRWRDSGQQGKRETCR